MRPYRIERGDKNACYGYDYNNNNNDDAYGSCDTDDYRMRISPPKTLSSSYFDCLRCLNA